TKRLEQQKAETGAARTREAQRHAEASARELRGQDASDAARDRQDAGRRTADDGQQQGQQPAPQQGTQQQGTQQQGMQQQGMQQQGARQMGQQSRGAGERQGSGADAARRAAGEMERAAEQLAAARSDQVSEWKQELT